MVNKIFAVVKFLMSVLFMIAGSSSVYNVIINNLSTDHFKLMLIGYIGGFGIIILYAVGLLYSGVNDYQPEKPFSTLALGLCALANFLVAGLFAWGYFMRTKTNEIFLAFAIVISILAIQDLFKILKQKTASSPDARNMQLMVTREIDAL